MKRQALKIVVYEALFCWQTIIQKVLKAELGVAGISAEAAEIVWFYL